MSIIGTLRKRCPCGAVMYLVDCRYWFCIRCWLEAYDLDQATKLMWKLYGKALKELAGK